MKKLVRDLEIGDRIELLNGSVGVVFGICINQSKNEAVIVYQNGGKTYALPNEEILCIK